MKNQLSWILIPILIIFSPFISWNDIHLPGMGWVPIPEEDDGYDHIRKNPFTGGVACEKLPVRKRVWAF
ncbi:MAG: hypothetical protein IRZ29_06510 [Thermoflavifilum sp.]|nr:hypothetical protein [Thermoflavifilum sp.]